MESKISFLLIEDNLIDQLVTKELLKKALITSSISIANNGEEGIQWLKNYKSKDEVLIILLDIQMPIMNGLGFLEEYKKLGERIKKKIQIYVLSSTLDPDEIKKIKENQHVKAFLNKPFPVEEFKGKLFN